MKSFVTIEQTLCVVCGKAFDTGSLLVNQRLTDTFERTTVTGWGICQADQDRCDQGYVALVECDPTKSGNPATSLKPENAHRTGRVLHVRKEAAERLFGKSPGPMAFVEPLVINRILDVYKRDTGEDLSC